MDYRILTPVSSQEDLTLLRVPMRTPLTGLVQLALGAAAAIRPV